MAFRSYSTDVLVLGRGLHGPWNEGTRVIGRNVAAAASALRRVHIVSLTHKQFQGMPDEHMPIDHVYTRAGYGLASDYIGLRKMFEHLRVLMAQTHIGIAHVVGLPLALAPWLRTRGVRVIYHVTLANQVYMGALEQLRARLGWRAFDRWIDAYALSSPALIAPLTARGLPIKKLTVIPAAIDTDHYRPNDCANARARLGLGLNERVVVYVGTLSPLRFPVDTIGAGLQGAASREAPIRFFGFAPNVTHDYNRKWSEDVAAQLGGIQGVDARITCGDLSDDDKRTWFQAADAVLLPFTSAVAVEPPLTLLEAMSCGAVVIATRHANRSELVQPDCNGMVYESPADLAGGLFSVFNRRETQTLDALRAAARATAIDRHGFAAAAAETAHIWDLVERGGA